MADDAKPLDLKALLEHHRHEDILFDRRLSALLVGTAFLIAGFAQFRERANFLLALAICGAGALESPSLRPTEPSCSRACSPWSCISWRPLSSTPGRIRLDGLPSVALGVLSGYPHHGDGYF
jgi:hypothetical protein